MCKTISKTNFFLCDDHDNVLEEAVENHDLEKLLENDEIARLMIKCVVVTWRFVLFKIIVFEISHYVFILSNHFYIKISEISKPCGKCVYEKHSPFPEVKAAIVYFLNLQTCEISYLTSSYILQNQKNLTFHKIIF